jgi:hypothetical protein
MQIDAKTLLQQSKLLVVTRKAVKLPLTADVLVLDVEQLALEQNKKLTGVLESEYYGDSKKWQQQLPQGDG